MTYRLTISSDTVYKNLVAEIVFKNGEMLVVSQERSNEYFEVSVFSKYRDSADAPSGPLMIDADEFEAALAEAKQKLASYGWR